MSTDSDEDFFDASPAIGEDATALSAQLALPGLHVSRPSIAPVESRELALQEPVLAIPGSFLETPYSTSLNSQASSQLRDTDRPSTAHADLSGRLDSKRRREDDTVPLRNNRLGADTLAELERDTVSHGHMATTRRFGEQPSDLFLDVANSSSSGERERVLVDRTRRTSSQTSLASKRRSLPADASLMSYGELRASLGGSGPARPPSRLRPGMLTSDSQRRIDRFRSSAVNSSFQSDDTVSVSGRSGTGQLRRLSNLQDQSPLSPTRLQDGVRSPELSRYGRRRPSFGTGSSDYRLRDSDSNLGKMPAFHDESPAESSEPKQTDSASVDSQTADTVWDELDDLKSRIKKLELTGKMPTPSSAPVSGDSSERPRTATTNPTTIDSSPKHERKAESNVSPQLAAPETTVGGPAVADIHPMLHAALAKAKPLLSGPLYRTLEATASDALQLALMTGNTGSQSVAFSTASVANGITMPDRQVRRKADTMCRNLTDLCLALCEGKYESPSATAATSPNGTEMAWRSSPSTRYPRSSLSPAVTATTRPMSRLEARRTSMLGPQGDGRRLSNDVASPEQESPVAMQNPEQLRRTSRAASGMLRQRYGLSGGVSPGDEDNTIRPPSRAMTEVNGLRSRLSVSKVPQRSPGLRDSLADMRRGNEGAFDSNREVSRIPTLDPRKRRGFDMPTSPVLEEDSASVFHGSSLPRQRINSAQQHSRRATTDVLPGRVSSLNQRRRMLAE